MRGLQGGFALLFFNASYVSSEKAQKRFKQRVVEHAFQRRLSTTHTSENT
jgi:hypothetical protein